MISIDWRESGDSTGVFEPTGSGSSEDKAANMRQVCHAAGLHVCDSAGVEELSEKPKADQESRGDEADSPEHEDKQKRANLIPRIGDDERAHHRGDGSAGAEVGHGGVRVGQNLGECGHEPAKQVEDKIAAPAHRIFDFGGKGPEENHVADDVRPTGMHEHGGQNRDPVMAGNNLRRH